MQFSVNSWTSKDLNTKSDYWRPFIQQLWGFRRDGRCALVQKFEDDKYDGKASVI